MEHCDKFIGNLGRVKPQASFGINLKEMVYGAKGGNDETDIRYIDVNSKQGLLRLQGKFDYFDDNRDGTL